MIDLEKQISQHFPGLDKNNNLFSKQAIKLLKILTHEDEINQFIQTHQHLKGLEFLESILEYFDFSYSVSNKDRENIPVYGRTIVVANHPIGSLDGLALLKFVKEIRPDVKIVTNELLYSIKPLRDFFIPLDNMSKKINYKTAYKQILEFLEQDGLVIVFPAGEVSRIRPNGVKDGKWQTGFLHFSKKAKAPIVPININAKNSAMFYSISALFKPFGTAMLAHEMFNKNHQNIHLRVGNLISHKTLKLLDLSKKKKTEMIRKQVYLLSKKITKNLFDTEQSITHPMDKKTLKQELKQANLLGQTQDGKKIFILDYDGFPRVMKEIGRLRELSFRMVDEGTGNRIDVDVYDRYYRHIVLWDEDDLEIVGAYRIGECDKIISNKGIADLYSNTLFDMEDAFMPYIRNSIELGRSFIQPRYWGLRGLDYLWYGIGAYLLENPQYKYMFGPVSLSNSYPDNAKDLIVNFYQSQFPAKAQLAIAKTPYVSTTKMEDKKSYTSQDYKENFKQLSAQLNELGVKVPTLYKQYTELCETGGVEFLDFNIDPKFSNCIDGLILVNVDKIKPKKRQRYIEAHKKG